MNGRVKIFVAGLAALACFLGIATARDLVLVIGAEGEPAYKSAFAREETAWKNAAAVAGFAVRTIDGSSASALHDLKDALIAQPKDGDDLWLVLIGHGTFDGKNAKFNLPGDDLSASDFAQWLKPFHRRLVILNLFSASGAFLPMLSGENRLILTATRSGAERNYSRFGEKLAECLGRPEADLDADGRLSVAELGACATAEVNRFYEDQQRLVPEHALIDDNGDRLGTETPLLAGPQAAPRTGQRDGALAVETSFGNTAAALNFSAAQSERRDAIEQQIADLRAHKSELAEDRYYGQLESLLLRMAGLYAEARARSAPAAH